MATLPCDKCGSSNGVEDYGDHTFCFVCHHRSTINNDLSFDIHNNQKSEDNLGISNRGKQEIKQEQEEDFNQKAVAKHDLSVSSLLNHSFLPVPIKLGPIPDRRISEETCKRYGVGYTENGDQAYPFYDKHNNLKAYKFRKSNHKSFLTKGDIAKIRCDFLPHH